MIRCLAIDDSPLALDLIGNYAGRIEYLHLVGRCQSAVEAIEILRKGSIDLVYLDIEMPDITGLDLLRSLTNKPKVIFTTAYPDYAIEGFNLDAADYLLKPFSFERFKKASDKVLQQLKLERLQKENNFILVKSAHETLKVSISDILYIEALKDYVQIFTKEKKVLSLMSMKEVLKLLPEEEFRRIHRSFIVPVSKISLFSGKKLTIQDKEIPVGDLYRKEFREFLKTRKII